MRIRNTGRAALIAAGAAIGAAVGAAPAPLAAADIWGLVIGIDAYESMPDLGGARNDADILSRALIDFGAREVRLILDEEATKARIEGAWTSILDRAAPGDVVVFTYSGHGGQEFDREGDEKTADQPDDETDETLILAAFDGGLNPEERIVDDELNLWFLEAERRGVKVVMLSDSCYSGTVTRGGRARLADAYALPPNRRKRPEPPSELSGPVKGLFFISGAQEAEVVVEVEHAGRYHGAASVAFAFALKGRADVDGDGALSRDEISDYVDKSAVALNEGRHSPNFEAEGGPDYVVLRPGSGGGRILDGDGAPLAAAGAALESSDVAGVAGARWNRTTGDVTGPAGGVLALGVEEARLGEVAEKLRLLQSLKTGVLDGGMTAELLRDGARPSGPLRVGEDAELRFGPAGGAYLTVFSLANNGEAYLIYPDAPQEAGPGAPDRSLSFEVTVAPPAGAEHVVAVATRQPPRRLRQALRHGPAPGELEELLSRLLLAPGAKFGLISLYSEE